MLAWRIADPGLLPEDIDFDPPRRALPVERIAAPDRVTTGDGSLTQFARAPMTGRFWR
jgi:hypothetical protein